MASNDILEENDKNEIETETLNTDTTELLKSGNSDILEESIIETEVENSIGTEMENTDTIGSGFSLDAGNEIELDDEINTNIDDSNYEETTSNVTNQTSNVQKEDWDDGYEQEELADALKMVEDFSSLLALKDALQKDLLENKDTLKKSLRNNTELNERVKRLEEYARLAEELRRDLSFVEEERNDALKKAQDLDFELKTITTASQKLKKDLEERDDLESTLLNLQERTALLEREKTVQIEHLDEQIAELTKNKDKAEDELAVLIEEHESLKVTDESLSMELKTSQSLIKQLSYEKEHLGNRVKFLEKEKVASDTKINQSSRKLRTRENENFLLQKYVSELRKELSDAKSSKEKISKELDVARKSFLELKDKLVNVMGSKEISGIV